MSNRFAQIVILAEDERSANLLRRYVERALGIKNRRIRQEISPSAKGDAKQWVLLRYPIEVQMLRSKHPKTGLVVHLDADTETVAQRASQLAASLRNDGQEQRAGDEWICHAIPRRQIETWLCTLTSVIVNEEKDCKKDRILPDFDVVVPSAALALYEMTRANVPAPHLPSLATAVPELQQLETYCKERWPREHHCRILQLPWARSGSSGTNAPLFIHYPFAFDARSGRSDRTTIPACHISLSAIVLSSFSNCAR